MQPSYEKPHIKKPHFATPDEICYDYRNEETAGQFRGVGQRGKVGLNNGGGIDAMPPKPVTNKVRRDHKG